MCYQVRNYVKVMDIEIPITFNTIFGQICGHSNITDIIAEKQLISIASNHCNWNSLYDP